MVGIFFRSLINIQIHFLYIAEVFQLKKKSTINIVKHVSIEYENVKPALKCVILRRYLE
jgi:hypothetical protein